MIDLSLDGAGGIGDGAESVLVTEVRGGRTGLDRELNPALVSDVAEGGWVVADEGGAVYRVATEDDEGAIPACLVTLSHGAQYLVAGSRAEVAAALWGV